MTSVRPTRGAAEPAARCHQYTRAPPMRARGRSGSRRRRRTSRVVGGERAGARTEADGNPGPAGPGAEGTRAPCGLAPDYTRLRARARSFAIRARDRNRCSSSARESSAIRPPLSPVGPARIRPHTTTTIRLAQPRTSRGNSAGKQGGKSGGGGGGGQRARAPTRNYSFTHPARAHAHRDGNRNREGERERERGRLSSSTCVCGAAALRGLSRLPRLFRRR